MASAAEEAAAATARTLAENMSRGLHMGLPESPDLTPAADPEQAATTPQTEQHPNLVEVANLIKLLMENQSTVNMRMFRELIKEQGLRGPEEKRNTEYKPPRQSENRSEPKSFARMQQFTGG